MSSQRNGRQRFNGALFTDNANQYPAAKLAQFAGQHVAWSLDGTQILAGGADRDAAERNLRALGLNPSEVVWDYVPAPDEDTVL
jgi:hypothetical protein